MSNRPKLFGFFCGRIPVISLLAALSTRKTFRLRQCEACWRRGLDGSDGKDAQDGNPDDAEDMPAPSGEGDAPRVFVVVAICEG